MRYLSARSESRFYHYLRGTFLRTPGLSPSGATMEKDAQTIIVEFNNNAAKIYSGVFAQFSNSVNAVDRNKDENIFQLQSGKYTGILKQQLEEQVKKILENYRTTGLNEELNYALPARVNYYVQEFRHKSNAL